MKTAVFHCFTCSKVQAFGKNVKKLKNTFYWVWATQPKSRVLCILTLKTAIFHYFYVLKCKDSGTAWKRLKIRYTSFGLYNRSSNTKTTWQMKYYIYGKSEAPQNMHFLRDHRTVLVSPYNFPILTFSSNEHGRKWYWVHL